MFKKIIIALALMIILVLATLIAGDRLFYAGFARKAGKIRAESPGYDKKIVDENYLKTLPEPVRRFAQFSGLAGKPMMRNSHVVHSGLFKTGPNRPWMKIRGEYYLTGQRPSFVWIGRISVLPFVNISAIDSYFSGRGRMVISLCGLVKLSDAQALELDASAFARMLTETSMIPTLYFDRDVITWKPMAGNKARALFTDSGLKTGAVVSFTGQGALERISLKRYREDKGSYVLDDWEGRSGDYKEFNGIMLPTLYSGSWVIDGKEFEYVRFRVEKAEFGY